MAKITFSPKANTATSSVVPQPYTEVFPKLYSEKKIQECAMFKAIFLVGGPGSGKDFLLKRVLEGYGLIEVSAEKVSEFFTENAPKQKKMSSMVELRQRLALEGSQGLIVNGTADDAQKILHLKDLLESAGYKTAMSFVTTTDESSRQRNLARGERGGRTVLESVRHEKWERAQASCRIFAEAFAETLMVFDNSHDLLDPQLDRSIKESKETELNTIRERVSAFLGYPVTQSRSTPESKRSSVSEDIATLGLRYYGFGRYGKQGMITHHLKDDHLMEIATYPKYSINGPRIIEEQSETTIDQLAKKHGVTPESIMAQLEIGIEVEMEHTDDQDIALKIALDHLNERPDYYTKLKALEKSPKQKLSLAQVKNKMQETTYGYDETTPQQWGPDKDEWNMRMGGKAGAPVKRNIFLVKKHENF